MQWRGRRTSRNIEDRRQAGGRRSGGGRVSGGRGRLGVGATLVVLLIGAYLGVDVTPFLNGASLTPSGQAPAGQTTSGRNQIDDDQEAFVATGLAETEAVWGTIFQASGQSYQEPVLVLYSGGTQSGCGSAQASMGPFYCPGDQRVYLDTDFFRVMQTQLQAGGEFANAYVIAHEVAHHVQTLTGRLGQVNAQRQRASTRESNELSVRLELQADCYAGIWAQRAADRLHVTDADIRQALATAARIGDDALQAAAGHAVVPDSFQHGSSEQRQRGFFAGFQSGDPQRCDTFAANAL